MRFYLPITKFNLYGTNKKDLSTSQKISVAHCLFFTKDYINDYINSKDLSLVNIKKLFSPIIHIDISFKANGFYIQIFENNSDNNYLNELVDLDNIVYVNRKHETKGRKQVIEKILKRELKIFKELG